MIAVRVHQALRYGQTHRYEAAWPICGVQSLRDEYALFFRQAYRVRGLARSYFEVNRGWRRSGHLLSHLGVAWTRRGWLVQVYYVPKRRRRRRRRRHGWRRFLRGLARPRLDPRYRRRRQRRQSRFLRRRQRRAQRLYRGWLRQRLRERVWGVRPRRLRFNYGPPQARSFPRGRSARIQRWAKLIWFRRRRRRLLLQELSQRAGHLLSVRLGVGVRWRWNQIPRPHLGNLHTVVAVLRYRMAHKLYRGVKGVAFPLMRLAERLPGVAGVALRCAGRFTRRQRAYRQRFHRGPVSRSDHGVGLDQAFFTAPIRFGAIGLKLTVNFGPHR